MENSKFLICVIINNLLNFYTVPCTAPYRFHAKPLHLFFIALLH